MSTLEKKCKDVISVELTTVALNMKANTCTIIFYWTFATDFLSKNIWELEMGFFLYIFSLYICPEIGAAFKSKLCMKILRFGWFIRKNICIVWMKNKCLAYLELESNWKVYRWFAKFYKGRVSMCI